MIVKILLGYVFSSVGFVLLAHVVISRLRQRVPLASVTDLDEYRRRRLDRATGTL